MVSRLRKWSDRVSGNNGFVFQAAERGGVNDAVAVPLKSLR
jgi:hypothetical protein